MSEVPSSEFQVPAEERIAALEEEVRELRLEVQRLAAPQVVNVTLGQFDKESIARVMPRLVASIEDYQARKVVGRW